MIASSRDGPWKVLVSNRHVKPHPNDSDTTWEYGNRFDVSSCAADRTKANYVQSIENVKIRKKIFGDYEVQYNCLKCGLDLTSKETEIGIKDHCPKCAYVFAISPIAVDLIAFDRDRRCNARAPQNAARSVSAGVKIRVTTPVKITGILFVAVIGLAFLPALIGKNEVPPSSTSKPVVRMPVEPMVEQIMKELLSTPSGRSEVQRIGGKDNDLTEFQKQHDISEEIAEAAIKEWVLTHNGQFDWNIKDVEAICLRNKKRGIPYEYLPESKK